MNYNKSVALYILYSNAVGLAKAGSSIKKKIKKIIGSVDSETDSKSELAQAKEEMIKAKEELEKARIALEKATQSKSKKK